MTTDRQRQIRRAIDGANPDPVRVGDRAVGEQAVLHFLGPDAKAELAYRRAYDSSKGYWRAYFANRERRRAAETKAELDALRRGIHHAPSPKPSDGAPRTGPVRQQHAPDFDRLLRRLGLNAEHRATISQRLAAAKPGDGVRLADGSTLRRLPGGGVAVRRGTEAAAREATKRIVDAGWRLGR